MEIQNAEDLTIGQTIFIACDGNVSEHTVYNVKVIRNVVHIYTAQDEMSYWWLTKSEYNRIDVFTTREEARQIASLPYDSPEFRAGFREEIVYRGDYDD